MGQGSMIRKALSGVALLLAPMALAGCIYVSVSGDEDHRPRGGAKSCAVEQYEYLIGKPAEQMNRSRLPSAFRVVCATCMVTQDYNPNRLTIQLDARDKVASVRCE
jgi:hypothetical protein